MQLLNNDRLDLNVLAQALAQPEPYAQSTHRFWDDPYITTQMLQHHLDPQTDAASRRPETIRAEADCIVQRTGLRKGMQALDLGCGPGLYVREFARTGAQVLGMDISLHSVQYAREHVQKHFPETSFTVDNYLTAVLEPIYDLITLIYYDFCALSPQHQQQLLKNVHAGLSKDGYFVLDVLTEHTHTQVGEKVTVFQEGLWSPDPYVEIYQAFLYPEPKTEGFQYTILDEKGSLRTMRIFHRLFSADEIRALLSDCGFIIEERFRDLSGRPWSEGAESMALFCRKK